MANILIEPSKAKSVLPQEDTLKATLSSFSGDVSSVRSGLRYKIAGQEQISARLKEAAEQLTRESGYMQALRNGLQQIIETYQQTETGNVENLVPEKTMNQNGQSGGGTVPPGNTVEELTEEEKEKQLQDFYDELMEVLRKLIDEWFRNRFHGGLFPFFPYYPGSLVPTPGLISPLVAGVTGLGGLGGQFLYTESKSKKYPKGTYEPDDFKVKRDPLGTPGRSYYDTKTGKWTDIDPNNKEQVDKFKEMTKHPDLDVRFAGFGSTDSISVYHDEYSVANDIGGHSGSYDVGKLEGSYGGYVGPGSLGFFGGVGFAALTAEEKAYLGSEDTNVHASVKGTLGKVEAKASGSVGLLDEKGHIDPHARLDAKAEALLGEVEGKIGGNALGVEGNLTGSLNVGIGAHANVGYDDGKFTFDVGASLGVGGSIKIEIDASDLVDKAIEAAGNVASTVKDVADVVSGVGKFLHLW